MQTQSPRPPYAYLASESAFLRHYMKSYWPSVAFASLCSLILGFISALLASLVGPSLQLLSPEQQGRSLHVSELFGSPAGVWLQAWTGQESFTTAKLLSLLPLLLLGLAGTKAAFYTLQSFLWERTGELMSKDMRRSLMSGYMHLDPVVRHEPEGRRQEAELSASLTSDIKLMREYLVHFYGGLPRESLQVFFLTAVLISLSPKLSLLFFCLVLPAVAFVQGLGRKLRRRVSKALSDYSSLSEWLQQRLLGVETIKHFHTEAEESARLQSLTAQLLQKFLRAARVKARSSPLVEMTALMALVGVLFIALQDIRKHELTGSIAISFFAALAMLAQSASMLARYANSNREASAAVGRLLNLSAYLESKQGKPWLETSGDKGEGGRYVLSCYKLAARYPGGTDWALQDFSYRFERRQIYCLTGPSGAGKSTLFRLLLGQLPPASGRVVFHGQGSRKSFLGYMPQQIVLMSGSLAENISYPDKSYEEARLWKALEQVDLASYVRSLPSGVETLLGWQGPKLSGGQAQRLLLARLYYHHFELILCDEGTSAVDPETEQLIYDGLKQLKSLGATIIMIAHRPSAIAIADHVLCLVPRGDPQKL